MLQEMELVRWEDSVTMCSRMLSVTIIAMLVGILIPLGRVKGQLDPLKEITDVQVKQAETLATLTERIANVVARQDQINRNQKELTLKLDTIESDISLIRGVGIGLGAILIIIEFIRLARGRT